MPQCTAPVLGGQWTNKLKKHQARTVIHRRPREGSLDNRRKSDRQANFDWPDETQPDGERQRIGSERPLGRFEVLSIS